MLKLLTICTLLFSVGCTAQIISHTKTELFSRQWNPEPKEDTTINGDGDTLIIHYYQQGLKPTVFTHTDSVNISDLKAIVLPMQGNLRTTFYGLIECWYAISKLHGKSEKKAFLETLDKIAAEIKKF